jgi:hypothetical protein
MGLHDSNMHISCDVIGCERMTKHDALTKMKAILSPPEGWSVIIVGDDNPANIERESAIVQCPECTETMRNRMHKRIEM